MSKWAPALLLMELDNLLWQGVNHLEIKQLWECCYLPRLASYDVLEEAITSGLCETEFFAYAASVGEDRYISLRLGERMRPEKSGYLVKVKAAKTQMERVAQEEEERQRAEHERQQGNIGGSGTAGAGTAGVTGTTPDGTNTGGQTGGGGNAGGTQPEPEIITHPPAPKSMSFYLSAQLDTTRVNRDVQKILEEWSPSSRRKTASPWNCALTYRHLRPTASSQARYEPFPKTAAR